MENCQNAPGFELNGTILARGLFTEREVMGGKGPIIVYVEQVVGKRRDR